MLGSCDTDTLMSGLQQENRIVCYINI